jgi:5'-methylthioadenosine phosphorylase
MKMGIIGGSGLYELDGMQDSENIEMDTPFGAPSDAYVHGTLDGVDVYFLPRHGVGHRLLPSELNHRANIYGFKKLGVDRVLSVSAVGSLKAELKPRDIVLPDQYFDRTKSSRQHTFFGDGVVGHVSFGEPTCPEFKDLVKAAAKAALAKEDPSDIELHVGGTYVNMEGPAFSTRAESNTYRHLGFDVIGMTSLGEAKLCREAEICYQPIAMVTDYDCWHESEEPVSAESVIAHLHANTSRAKRILAELIPSVTSERSCGCSDVLKYALMSSREGIPPETKEKLGPIVSKYL